MVKSENTKHYCKLCNSVIRQVFIKKPHIDDNYFECKNYDCENSIGETYIISQISNIKGENHDY